MATNIDLLQIIGNVISFGLFAAPAPTFWKIIKRKAVEDFSPNPYLATIPNFALWVFSAMLFVHPYSTFVITINSVGLAMEIIYICIYCKYANKKQRLYVLKVLVAEILFFTVVAVLALNLLHMTQKRSLMIGICCFIFNTAMYVMLLDIKTKSVEYMPRYIFIVNFLNGLTWLTSALLCFKFFDDLLITQSCLAAWSSRPNDSRT